MSEKAVQRRIVVALETMGFEVCDLTQPRATMMPAGLPDLYARHVRFGRHWIEVKAGRNKPSMSQLAWHAAERACGGSVIVAWSVDDVLAGLRAAGVPVG